MATVLDNSVAIPACNNLASWFSNGSARLTTSIFGVLVSWTMDPAAFNNATMNGNVAEATLKRAYTATAGGTGTAAHFFGYSSGASYMIRGDVGAEVTINNASITINDQVTLNSWVIKYPRQ